MAHVHHRQKSTGLATILSFLWTGFGQIYNGDILKGVGLMGLQSLNALAVYALFILGLFNRALLAIAVLWALFSVGVWIYGMYDAHEAAARLNAA